MAQQYPLMSFEQANPGLVGAANVSSLADKLANAGLMREKTLADILESRVKSAWTPYTALGAYAGGLGRLGMAQYYLNNPIALTKILQSPQFMYQYSHDPNVARNTDIALAGIAGRAAQGAGGEGSMGVGVRGSMDPRNIRLPTPKQLFSGAPAEGSYNVSMPNVPTGSQSMADWMQTSELGEDGTDSQTQPTYYAPTQGTQVNAPRAAQTVKTAGAAPKGQAAPTGTPVAATAPTTGAMTGGQEAVGDVLEKKRTTATLQQQRTYANAVIASLNDIDQLIPDVARYSGAGGAAKKMGNVLATPFGKESPEYRNYLNFQNSIVPLSAELKKMLNAPALEAVNTELHGLFDLAKLGSNPKIVQSRWDNLHRTLLKYADAYSQGNTKTLNSLDAQLRNIGKYSRTGSGTGTGSAKGTKEDWLAAARKSNPGASDQELMAYYNKTYGGK